MNAIFRSFVHGAVLTYARLVHNILLRTACDDDMVWSCDLPIGAYGVHRDKGQVSLRRQNISKAKNCEKYLQIIVFTNHIAE